MPADLVCPSIAATSPKKSPGAGRHSVQLNPQFSVCHAFSAAALARCDLLDEAKGGGQTRAGARTDLHDQRLFESDLI
jgi:hypothetical protein